MDQAIQLYGYLVLTFLAFVIPIVAILLSIFNDGITNLAIKFGIEKNESEKKIKDQLKKIADSESTDTYLEEIKLNLKKLEKNKKNADKKLSYLNPKKQLINLAIPLLLSIIAVIVSLLYIDTNIYVFYGALIISLLLFLYEIILLYFFFAVIIEAKTVIDKDKKQTESKFLELLSILVEKAEEETQFFLKNVNILVDDNIIGQIDGVITISNDKEQELRVSILNKEFRMAKQVQIGFVFTYDFLIEEESYYSIYTAENNRIVRYNQELIHGNTNLNLRPLIITPLKSGNFDIGTFIHAENIETKSDSFRLEVKEPDDNIIKSN